MAKLTLNGRFERSDLLYLAVLAGFCFLLLSQIKNITLQSYGSLLSSGVRWGELLLPVAFGVVFSLIVYVVLRLRFSQLNSFIVSILTATSAPFVGAFVAGSFSAPVALLFGYVALPISFNIERVAELVFIMPLAVAGIAYFALRRNMLGVAISVIAILASFWTPLLALPALAIVGAFGLELVHGSPKEPSKQPGMHEHQKRSRWKEKWNDILFAFLLMAALMFYVLGTPTLKTAGFAVFASALVSSVLYIAENRHKLNIIILLAFLFVSIFNGFAAVHSIARLDSETLLALDQLKLLDGKIGIVTAYGNETQVIVKYLSGKTTSFEEGVNFMFASDAPSIDYLLLDTRMIDNPAALAALFDKSAKFETFAYAGMQKSNTSYFIVYTSRDSVLAFQTNEKGALVSDRGILNGESVSIYRFLNLEANNPAYSRYIYPRSGADQNILKLLFPEQFGAIDNSTEIWHSNSSRMRLYKLTP